VCKYLKEPFMKLLRDKSVVVQEAVTAHLDVILNVFYHHTHANRVCI